MARSEMPDIPSCNGCGAGAHGMDRRTFLSSTALAAAALALSACGGDALTAPGMVDGTVNIADHPSLAAVNGVALVSISNSPVAVVRTGAATFVALSRVCPHQGNLINVSTNGFLCSGHQAQFTLNGTWRGGQATSNMRSYPISFDASANTLTIG